MRKVYGGRGIPQERSGLGAAARPGRRSWHCVHAGMEGRPYPHLAFGKIYVGEGPKYYFRAMIGLKLPIGLRVVEPARPDFLLCPKAACRMDFATGGILAAVISLTDEKGGLRHLREL
jgi:hypothetical protein